MADSTPFFKTEKPVTVGQITHKTLCLNPCDTQFGIQVSDGFGHFMASIN